MSIDFCPGSAKFREPQADEVRCPNCGYLVEIWSDEVQVVCPKCKNKILRTQDGASCLDWCKEAARCVGKETYENYLHNKAITLKDKLLKELEEFFGQDKKRIDHAKKVLGFAEELLKKEPADWHIVIPAAILHDVGIKIAEEKYGSSAGNLQEKEGPAAARKILLKMTLKKEDIEEICAIIAHHHTPGKIDTDNFKVLYDSDWLVNLKDEANVSDKQKLENMIKRIFLTAAGKELAEKIYLKEE
ncbi:MAG: phosphohydrolase [Candidatus Omnitrophica bacterium CG11_big_fil_rev_8_21_14_0_20_42_13]|uniref:Phosphohydrolase n=1 Tax=Candidatus Ghiorseimicrobium undicola TaxID=1974746 RepID=A0A2H0LXH1_9BACT|nr:MAG: phosphohydrolase [Candidatus Omnitrophica bacterium CG11_big_fil_rev_8_21_14_0_20_42_13]